MQLQLKKFQKISFVFCSCVAMIIICLFNNSLVAVASDTLPPGIIIGDDQGISASSDGEFFVDLPNIMPGERYEKTITIRSLDLKEPFELGLLVIPKSSSGTIDFNKSITLTLTVDGKEIYKGNLLGNGKFDWTVQPLIIGTCKYGEDQILKAVFEVDGSLTNEDYKESSELLYYWTFVATKNITPPSSTTDSTSASSTSTSSTNIVKPTGKFPMTGEQIRNLIYQILAGLLLILIAILLWKKKKEEEQRDSEL